jgi:hypothetical protein
VRLGTIAIKPVLNEQNNWTMVSTDTFVSSLSGGSSERRPVRLKVFVRRIVVRSSGFRACLRARIIQPRTRISCHAALDGAARAPFSKERRMKFAKATEFYRKSGGRGVLNLAQDGVLGWLGRDE